MLEASLRSLKVSTQLPIEVVVILEDKFDLQYLQTYYDSLASDTFQTHFLMEDKRVGYAKCVDDGSVACDGDLIMLGDDDYEWQPGWLDAALKAHSEILHGYGLVGINDMHKDGNALSNGPMDRKFVQEILGGRIFFPLFRKFCADTVAMILAKRSNSFYWCEDAKVKHYHYSYNKRDKDTLDIVNEQWLNSDITILDQWCDRGCNIEWTPLL